MANPKVKVRGPLLPLLLLWVITAGCSTVTNLTPSQHVRNSEGLYPCEVEWMSRQHSLRPESIKAYVVIDLESYPMQRTYLLSNRWETLIPVSTNLKHLTYRFKFDYEYDSVPRPRPNSLLSRPYQLTIIQRP